MSPSSKTAPLATLLQDEHVLEPSDAVNEQLTMAHPVDIRLALQVKVPGLMYSGLPPSSCLMSPQFAWLLSSRLPPKQVGQLTIGYLALLPGGMHELCCPSGLELQ